MASKNIYFLKNLKKKRGKEALKYGQVEAGRMQNETLAIARAWELRRMFYSE